MKIALFENRLLNIHDQHKQHSDLLYSVFCAILKLCFVSKKCFEKQQSFITKLAISPPMAKHRKIKTKSLTYRKIKHEGAEYNYRHTGGYPSYSIINSICHLFFIFFSIKWMHQHKNISVVRKPMSYYRSVAKTCLVSSPCCWD